MNNFVLEEIKLVELYRKINTSGGNSSSICVEGKKCFAV